MGILNIAKRIFVWWDTQTIGTQLWSWRNGIKVGEDEMGNTYFHNRDDSKRWVIFNGEIEGSRVPPVWHGWLHNTFDEIPTDADMVRKDWQKPHQPNMTGTSQAYAPQGSIRRAGPAPRADYEAWTPE